MPAESVEAGVRPVDPSRGCELGADAAISFFTAAFATAPDALMLVEADGTIALANAAAEEMFGLPLSRLVGR